MPGSTLSPTDNLLDPYSARNSQYAIQASNSGPSNPNLINQSMLIGMNSNSELTEPVW